MKRKRHTGDGENSQPRGFLHCSFIETVRVGEEEKMVYCVAWFTDTRTM